MIEPCAKCGRKPTNNIISMPNLDVITTYYGCKCTKDFMSNLEVWNKTQQAITQSRLLILRAILRETLNNLSEEQIGYKAYCLLIREQADARNH